MTVHIVTKSPRQRRRRGGTKSSDRERLEHENQLASESTVGRSSGASGFLNDTIYMYISRGYKGERSHAKPSHSSALVFMSRISTVTHRSVHGVRPGTPRPEPGERARFGECWSSASSRIRMNKSNPSSRSFCPCRARGHRSVSLRVLATWSSAATLPGLVGAGRDVRSPPQDPAPGVSQKRPPERRFGSFCAVVGHPLPHARLYTRATHNHSPKPVPNAGSF